MKAQTVLVSVDSGSILKGARYYKELFQELVHRYNLDSMVDVLETGSLGIYREGVLVSIFPDGIYYEVRSKEDVERVVSEHLLKGRAVSALMIDEEIIKKDLPKEDAMTVETRIVLRNVGVIDPLQIEEYIARDGYMALGKVLSAMKPKDVIDILKESGLKGRGGAGFPTGRKWEFTAQTDSDVKYILCNADEGEPGTFKDRLIMEGDPHSVIEAMAIAGYSVGASKGYIYIRGEYYGSIDNLNRAIQDAYEWGFLGQNILGTAFSFDLTIRLGAGAYICGEETALIESIEGKPGRPRFKPPYPPVAGLSETDRGQQRRDVRERAMDYLERPEGLQEDWDRVLFGNEGLHLGWQHTKSGARGGPDGNHRLRSRLPLRRRLTRWQRPEDGANRRNGRHVRPPGSAERQIGLRFGEARRLDRFRGHPGDGYGHLRRGSRESGDGVLRARVVRKVHPLPRGNPIGRVDFGFDL